MSAFFHSVFSPCNKWWGKKLWFSYFSLYFWDILVLFQAVFK